VHRGHACRGAPGHLLGSRGHPPRVARSRVRSSEG
jgi:hypothetical protein